MKPIETLGQAVLPDGTVLKLARRGEEYLITAGGPVLMSSRMHGSEEELAKVACERLRSASRPRVLIGGLGMGYTLRATLNLLPKDATVVVSELVKEVVEWNRGELSALAGHPLRDRRVEVEIRDVAESLRAHAGEFDAVLLDVDNGPAAFTDAKNAQLYDEHGVATIREALKEGGVLALWALREDEAFVRRMRRGGFAARMKRVRGHAGRGPRHVIFVGVAESQ